MSVINLFNFTRLAQAVSVITILTTTLVGGTYYVDFAAGNDDNAGNSMSAPWKTLPGTRTLDGATWLRTDYGQGAVSKTAKVRPGTTFKLKRGTTYNAAIGGFLWIDKTFYADGASSTNSISIELADGWGSGPATFDGLAMPITVSLILIQQDGILMDGKTKNGIRVRNSPISGLMIKEKAGTSAAVAQCALVNLELYNNGWSYASDAAGAGAGQVNVRKAVGLRLERLCLNGNHNYINGVILGDNHKTVTDALVLNCEAFNHQGDIANNDAGIGFKAFNSQVVFKTVRSHDNLKGFDLGEQSSDNARISYQLLGCTTYNNTWGANMNCSGANTYTNNASFYVVNTLVYSNSIQGMNVYSGPFDLHIVHSVFANNGSNCDVSKATGHLRVTPSTRRDAGAIHTHLYNNIFYKAYHAALTTSYFERATNSISLDSDYNAYVQGGSEVFCRWAYFHSGESRDFAFGVNGPGNPVGQWATFFGDDGLQPKTDCTGHLGSDTHSKGTGAEDSTLPQFMDASTADFRLLVNSPGANLTAQPWYIPDMGRDRAGLKRVTWNMGAFDAAVATQ